MHFYHQIMNPAKVKVVSNLLIFNAYANLLHTEVFKEMLAAGIELLLQFSLQFNSIQLNSINNYNKDPDISLLVKVGVEES